MQSPEVDWSAFNVKGIFGESESFCGSKLHKYTLSQVPFSGSMNTVLYCKDGVRVGLGNESHNSPPSTPHPLAVVAIHHLVFLYPLLSSSHLAKTLVFKFRAKDTWIAHHSRFKPANNNTLFALSPHSLVLDVTALFTLPFLLSCSKPRSLLLAFYHLADGSSTNTACALTSHPQSHPSIPCSFAPKFEY